MASIGNGLQLVITEDVDGDGFITAAEASGLVGLRATLPIDAIVGDRIVVTDSLGNQAFKVLDAADIAAGELAGDVFALPASGQTLTVTAEIVAVDGTVRASTSASAVVQLIPPGGGITEAPVVEIIEDTNQDGRIDATELSGLIGARVTLPPGAVVGDSLVAVDQSGYTVSKVLDANDIANGSLQGDVFIAPADGQVFSLSVTIVDALGQSSPAGIASVVMDLGGGVLPSVTLDEVLDTVGAVQGPVAEGGLTDTGLLIFSGSGVAGTVVEIQDAGVAIGTSVVDQGGIWRFAPQDALSDGAHQITAVALDAAGNPGPPSAVASFTVDSVAPSAPTVTLLNDLDNNERLTPTEQAAATGADVQVDLPADAVAGALLVLIDQAGHRAERVLTAADVQAGVLVLSGVFPLPAAGQALVVQAGIQNAAGNLSELAVDGALVLGAPLAAPVVVIAEDANADGVIEAGERSGVLDYRIELPATGAVGAQLQVDWVVGDASGSLSVGLDAAALAAGFVVLGGEAGGPPQPAAGESVAISASLVTALGEVSAVGSATAWASNVGLPGDQVLAAYEFNDAAALGQDAAGGEQTITFFGNPGQTLSADGSQALDLIGGATAQYGEILGLGSTGGAMTVAANVRFDTTAAWQRVFDFGQTQAGGIGNIYVGRLGNSSDLTFTIEQNDGTGLVSYRANAVGAITDGVWLNFVATVDSAGLMKLYVNGQLAATTQGVAPDIGVRDHYFVGKSAFAVDGPFDGAIDNLVVLKTSVNAAQAAELSGITLPPNSPPVHAAPVEAQVTEGASVTVDLLSQSTDADGDALTAAGLRFTVDGRPTGNAGTDLPIGVSVLPGALVVDAAAPAYQVLAAGEQQAIGVRYGVSDGQGGQTAQTATIALTGVNDAPVLASATLAAQAGLFATTTTAAAFTTLAHQYGTQVVGGTSVVVSGRTGTATGSQSGMTGFWLGDRNSTETLKLAFAKPVYDVQITWNGQTSQLLNGETLELKVNGQLVQLSAANLGTNTAASVKSTISADQLHLVANGGLLGTSNSGGVYTLHSATPINTFEVVNTVTSFWPGGSFVQVAIKPVSEQAATGVALSQLMPAASDVDNGSSLAGYAIASAAADTTGHHWEVSRDGGASWSVLDAASTAAAVFVDSAALVRWTGQADTQTALIVSAVDNTVGAAFGTPLDLSATGGDTPFSHPALLAAGGQVTPLVLDLDGNGVQTTSLADGVTFDIAATGAATATAWLDTKDGFLVLDRNGDGIINDGSEMFGSATPMADGRLAADGFAALAQLDGNADGAIDAADAAYAQLQVWVDANHDGLSQAGELQHLADLGITSLGLDAVVDGSSQNGNLLGLSGQFSTADGGQGALVDVLLSTAPAPAAQAPSLADLLEGAAADGTPVVSIDELIGGGTVLSASLPQADSGPICYAPQWTPMQLETGAEASAI